MRFWFVALMSFWLGASVVGGGRFGFVLLAYLLESVRLAAEWFLSRMKYSADQVKLAVSIAYFVESHLRLNQKK